MTYINDTEIINKRYHLQQKLGEGGMGAVYCALDRVTNQKVALKRVTSALVKEGSAALYHNQDAQVALTQEFKTLAALRHPHIVSVLDYGFDENRLPYFTMQLLQNAETILDAGSKANTPTKIQLIIQLLQAIDYLHWRNILHRDLKPANVMVVDGQVKVLDFGLSIIHKKSAKQETHTTAGTFAYMAPEVFQNSAPDQTADLYAVGVMAYELLVGRHPFHDDNLAIMLSNVLENPVDVWSVGLDNALADVLGNLLAKDRQARFPDAAITIHALCQATNTPPPPETTEIRDSFLQTATFIGRQAELTQLTQALSQATKGQGSAWLVGGESGVGKSRILDEVRTLALVKGMIVVRTQAVQAGSTPYQLWQQTIQRLILTTPVTEEEASILKLILPNITSDLNRPVPNSILEPEKAQAQLVATITNLLNRQTHPFLLLLEDLQWASNNSLDLLHAITAVTTTTPFMLLGNYRDDERPDLPDLVPDMQALKLKRLTTVETAELSASVLGEIGRQPHIVNFLQRETEGNPFFLVEVVRALAEQAGQLQQIGTITLPTQILTGGLRQLIQRRLNRVPAIYHPLLHLMAVGGRTLDLPVLRATLSFKESTFNLDSCLALCNNAALLEIRDDSWQFAHDKLREGILLNLSDSERQALHQQIAQAIESTYNDTTTVAARLAHHWAEAENLKQEAHYAHIAGDQALRIGANVAAKAFFEQTLDALAQLPSNRDIQKQFVDCTISLARVGAYLPSENILERLQEALTFSQALADERRQAHILGSIGAYYFMTGRTGPSLQFFNQSMDLAEQLAIQELLVMPYNILGRALAVSGNLPASEAMLAKGIPLAQSFDDQELLAGSLAMYATVLWLQGKRDQAKPYISQSLTVAEQVGRPSRIAGNLMTLGFGYTFGGFFEEAIDTLNQCLKIADQTQDLHPTYMAHGCLGAIYWQQEEADKAYHHLQHSLHIAKEHNVFIYVPIYQAYYATFALNKGASDIALAQLEAALELAQKTQQGICQGEVLRIMAYTHRLLPTPNWQKAEALLRESQQTFQKCNALPFIGLIHNEYRQLYQAQGFMEKAHSHTQEALTLFETLEMSWHLKQIETTINL